MNDNVPNNWHETFFSVINCEIWEKAVNEKWSEKKVRFLIDLM